MTKKKKNQRFHGKMSLNRRQPVTTATKRPELNRYYQDTFDFVNRQSKIVVFVGMPILFLLVYLSARLMGQSAPILLEKYFIATVSIISMICTVFLIVGLAGKATVNVLGGNLTLDQKDSLRRYTFRLGFIILSSQIFVYDARFHWFERMISFFSLDAFNG